VKGANTGEIFKGIEGILPPSLASIRCANEDIVVPQYLYYLLKGYEKALMSQAKGSTIKSLVSKTILDLKCWIPTIDEQLRLVSYLDKVIGKIVSVSESETEPPFVAHIYQGLPKGDKLETVIQKSVECGASSITTFESEFCIAKSKPDAEKNKVERRNDHEQFGFFINVR
jgi:hypothetical protein